MLSRALADPERGRTASNRTSGGGIQISCAAQVPMLSLIRNLVVVLLVLTREHPRFTPQIGPHLSGS